MHQDIKKVLYTEEQIQNKIKELAAVLTEEYRGKNPIFVGVMKGVVLFFSDMVKRIDTPCRPHALWPSATYFSPLGLSVPIIK